MFKYYIVVVSILIFIVGCSKNSELINPKTSKQIQKRIELLGKTLNDTKGSTIISQEKRIELEKEIVLLKKCFIVKYNEETSKITQQKQAKLDEQVNELTQIVEFQKKLLKTAKGKEKEEIEKELEITQKKLYTILEIIKKL